SAPLAARRSVCRRSTTTARPGSGRRVWKRSSSGGSASVGAMGWSTTQAAWTLGLLALLGARAGRAQSLPSPLAARDAAAALVAVSGAELRWRPETGVAARVRLPLTGSGDLAPAPAGTPLERRLESFFAAHGAVFGVRDASSELHRASTWQDEQ